MTKTQAQSYALRDALKRLALAYRDARSKQDDVHQIYFFSLIQRASKAVLELRA